jgi:MFS family permease
VLIGYASSYLLFVLGCAIFGIGKGLYAIPSRAMLSDLFVARRGRALGLYGAGSDFGGAVASGVAVLVLAYATWRTPFVPLAALLVALAVLFALWTRESYTVSRSDLEVAETTRRLLATSRQRRTLFAYMLFYFMVNGILNFLPGYLREVKGLSPELASTGFALLFVLGIVIKPVAGGISDRFPRRLVSTAALLISAVAIGLLLVVESIVLIGLTIALLAVGYKGQLPVVDAILIDAAPTETVGGDLGAARTLFLGSGSIGPAFVGITADNFGYGIAFVMLGVAALLGAILLYSESRRTD